MAENIRLRAGDRFLIRNADDATRHAHAGLQQHRRTRFAEATVNAVFLDRDYGAASAAGAQNSFSVEWFDCVHRNDATVQAAFRQLTGGEQRVNHRFTGGDERRVIPVVQLDCFAEFKF